MKEYLKMGDGFYDLDVGYLEQRFFSGLVSKEECTYAAHAISSHDDLVQESASRWIPCSDRLPAKDSSVLVYDERWTHGAMYTVQMSDHLIACLAGDEFSEAWRGVTHWMPLPTAPKPRCDEE